MIYAGFDVLELWLKGVVVCVELLFFLKHRLFKAFSSKPIMMLSTVAFSSKKKG